MSSLSTHVLDAVRGAPATGVAVTLFDSGGNELASGSTDADGRVGALGPDLSPGIHRLVFGTADYFAAQGVDAFYPEVSIAFTVGSERHYHVPLLLSPFAYSTYRGS
ncbi:hydroxyisourate hydrolase [Nocardia inohanensis]|uniref:hydroxyisourate hydrolase n=1 Tax=Nocardia inohanensis TaxID=209246 RepID=UPI00082B851A|nr:hydroxyisourate hydrolase [Nocardia inohanensis]